MCSPPEEISSVLPLLKEEFDGPLGAYANIGYSQDPTARTDETIQWHRIEIGDNIPDQYAKITLDWVDKGAQIVGGCCAATPDHISAIRSLISSSSH